MSEIYELLGWMTDFIQPYLGEISLTLLATILVVYGDVINKHIKRMISPYHFIVRTVIFVLVCAFGYGLIIVFSSPYLKQLFLLVPYHYRGLTVFTLFLLLGYLAENRRYI